MKCTARRRKCKETPSKNASFRLYSFSLQKFKETPSKHASFRLYSFSLQKFKETPSKNASFRLYSFSLQKFKETPSKNVRLYSAYESFKKHHRKMFVCIQPIKVSRNTMGKCLFLYVFMHSAYERLKKHHRQFSSVFSLRKFKETPSKNLCFRLYSA